MTTTWDLLTETFDRSEYLNSAGSGNAQFLDKLLNSAMFADLDDQASCLAGALAAMSGTDLYDCFELDDEFLAR